MLYTFVPSEFTDNPIALNVCVVEKDKKKGKMCHSIVKKMCPFKKQLCNNTFTFLTRNFLQIIFICIT